MIIGDKIATVHLLHENTPVVVEVVAIEKGEIVWQWAGPIERKSPPAWWLANAHASGLTNPDGTLAWMSARGRVRKRDRGVTWAPAWIEAEVNLLRVTAALGPQP